MHVSQLEIFKEVSAMNVTRCLEKPLIAPPEDMPCSYCRQWITVEMNVLDESHSK